MLLTSNLLFMFTPSYRILKSQFGRLFLGKAWGHLAVLFTLALEGPLFAQVPTPTSILKQPVLIPAAGLLSGGSMELNLTVKGSGSLYFSWSKSSRVTTLAGSPGLTGSTDGVTGVSLTSGPVGIAYYDNALYVADCGNHTIRKIDPATKGISTLAGIPGLEGAQNGPLETATFSKPFGVAVDASGNVYVSDAGNHLIRKIATTGTVSTVAGKAGLSGSKNATGPDARFNYPTGLAYDNLSNSLFVADAGNHQIRMVDISSGSVTIVAGTAGFPGANDGTGASARFKNPSGLAMDGGTLYVADAGNSSIRKVDLNTKAVTTLAGVNGQIGDKDGNGNAARFRGVGGLAIDNGTLYVGDTGNHTVRKVSASGMVSTYAGVTLKTGSLDSESASALMKNPLGMATDRLGNVYLADTDNYTVRQIIPLATVGGSQTSSSGTSFTISSSTLFLKKAPVDESDTGFYNCLVIGGSGSVRSNSVYVQVNTLPYITTQPLSTTIVTGGSVNLSTTAVGTGTLSYQWRKGGEPIKSATQSSYSFVGKTNGDSGSYDCLVSNVAGYAITSPAIVVVNSTNAAIVGGSFFLCVSPQTGTVTYKSSNLPPGLTLNTYTGLLTGVPTKSGSYAVTVQAIDEALLTSNSLSFSVAVAPLAPGVTGTFTGIIDRSPINGDMGSSFQLTTTPEGSFSGSILTAGTSIVTGGSTSVATGTSAVSFTGRLATSLGDSKRATIKIVLSKPEETNALILAGTLDSADNTLKGTLTKGGTATAAVTAWRNAWADVPGNAVKFKGPYSFYLENKKGALKTKTPQGYGFGTFEVNSKTGALALAGTLPDGTKFTQSTLVSQAGVIPVYTSLYNGKGTLTGILKITKGGFAPLDNTLDPEPPDALPQLTWKKHPIANDLLFSEGFEPVSLTAQGGIYTAPPAGSRLFGASAVNSPATNVTITLWGDESDAPLSLPQTRRDLNISATGAVGISTTAPLLTFTAVNLSTGSFSGSLATSVKGRSAVFAGQIVGKGDEAVGYGYYLLSGTAGVAPQKSSGKVEFGKKPLP